MFQGELGVKVKDKISGFEGVVTGSVKYLSGCNQALVISKVGADGRMGEPVWFDWQRLDIVDANAIKLDNGEHPGFDAPAPRRY